MFNMASSLSAYILVSIITYKKEFDLDKMLHRDKPVSTDVKQESVPVYGLRAIGIGSEFSKFDKVVYYSLLAWSGGWFLAFAIITLLKFTVGLPDGFWPNFWRAKIWIYFTLGTIINVWFAIGGFRDLINMYKTLSTMKRDSGDDGHVEHNK
jgi:SSS family solute:Na+ symporter